MTDNGEKAAKLESFYLLDNDYAGGDFEIMINGKDLLRIRLAIHKKDGRCLLRAISYFQNIHGDQLDPETRKQLVKKIIYNEPKESVNLMELPK